MEQKKETPAASIKARDNCEVFNFSGNSLENPVIVNIFLTKDADAETIAGILSAVKRAFSDISRENAENARDRKETLHPAQNKCPEEQVGVSASGRVAQT